MKLLRISIYVLIVLAIAKITGGNKTQMPEETTYDNTFSYRAIPQLEQQGMRQVMNNDSVTYVNFYSNLLPFSQKPMYIKSNNETSSMLMRIYQSNQLQSHKSDLDFSFIVF